MAQKARSVLQFIVVFSDFLVGMTRATNKLENQLGIRLSQTIKIGTGEERGNIKTDWATSYTRYEPKLLLILESSHKSRIYEGSEH